MDPNPLRGAGPLIILSAACLAGHLAGLAAWSSWWMVAAAFGAMSLLLVAARRFRGAAAVTIALCCGAMSAGRVGFVDPDEAGRFIGTEVAIRAKLPEVSATDDGWRGLAEEATIETLDGRSRLRLAAVAVRIRNPDAAVRFPAEIRATGRLHPAGSLGNPSEMPREWGVLASRAQYLFSADAGKTILLPDPDGGGPFRFARERVERSIERAAGRSDGALYLTSLATGKVPPPGHPLVVLFRNTGLAHLFAISGVNVVIFFSIHAGLMRSAIWIFRKRKGHPDLKRISALVSFPVCWGFVLMAGAPVPAVRSAGMITAAVLLRTAWAVGGAGFGLAAMLLLTTAVSPCSVLTPSFLLSYGAVCCLVIAASGDGSGETGVVERGIPRRIRDMAASALKVSAVAFCGTLPISGAFFSGLPAGAILWNVLFGPLLGAGGVAGAFLAVVGGTAGIRFLDPVVGWVAAVLDRVIAILRFASGNGAACFPLPPAGPWPMAFFTISGVVSAAWLKSRGKPAWAGPVASGILFLAWIHLPYAGMPDSRFRLTALNVVNGASHVLSFPGGGTMVLDCGSALRGDAGNRVLVPFLRANGIRRVDLLVLSHAHEDHYGGAEALLGAVDVGEIWIPEGVPVGRFGPAVAHSGVKVRPVGKGASFAKGGTRIEVRSASDGKTSGENGASLVIRAGYGRFSAWMPGDVEGGPAAWGSDSGKPDEWRALFLPHHGSKGANPSGWLEFALPNAAIVQNRNCLAQENLITSGRIYALEQGALTFLSDGRSMLASQENAFGFWRYLCRLP
jgi:competence protein ComEC